MHQILRHPEINDDHPTATRLGVDGVVTIIHCSEIALTVWAAG